MIPALVLPQGVEHVNIASGTLPRRDVSNPQMPQGVSTDQATSKRTILVTLANLFGTKGGELAAKRSLEAGTFCSLFDSYLQWVRSRRGCRSRLRR